MVKETDDEILRKAKKRFKTCQEWESVARERALSDMKFVEGDHLNMYQWGDDSVAVRVAAGKPCLTINKTRECVLQIVNDARQHETSIVVRASGQGASVKAAEAYEGMIRRIENRSNAQDAYDCAIDGQVKGGIGYTRVTTDYADNNSFDQEIKIVRVPDPFSIYIDPDIQEYDGSDMRYAFVFKNMTHDEYEDTYGDLDDIDSPNSSPLGLASDLDDDWNNEVHIRICEYFVKVDNNDTLHEFEDGRTEKNPDLQDGEFTKNPVFGKMSDIKDLEDDNPGIIKRAKKRSKRQRDIATPKIKWYLLAGGKIIDTKDWPGKYIPIVRWVGTQTVINKQLDRKGHVRNIVDAQKNYNFWASGAIENVALQTKTPYIASAEAVEEYQGDWARANQENLAYLPYNAYDSSGKPLPPPQRAQAPEIPPAFITGLQIAKDQMQLSSGQYEANFGAKSNETSGRAIQERQRAGDNSTFHFTDHQAIALRYTGKIIVDLIPFIYDTKREMKILNSDGTQQSVQLDPNHPLAHTQLQDPDDDETYNPEELTAIFNPSVGDYEIDIDTGPSFLTQRQDTFNALSQLMQADPALMQIAGDLLMKNAPFNDADEIAKRLRNMVPKQALGQQAPDPQIAQLQQMMAKQHEVMQDLTQKLEKAESKQNSDSMQKDLDWYKAETDRMAVVGKIDPQALIPVIRQTVSQILQMPVNMLIAAHAQQNEAMAGSDTQMQAQEHAHQQAMQNQQNLANQQATAQSAGHASDLSAQNANQAQQAVDNQPQPPQGQ